MFVCHFKSICTYVLWGNENYKLIENELEFTGSNNNEVSNNVTIEPNPRDFLIIETKWLTIARN